MQKHLSASVILALAAASAIAADGTLSCEGAAQDAKVEASLMKRGPGAAQRIGKHVLEVRVAGITKRFVDQPPFDEELAGTRWHYCGYDAANRIHLLGKSVEDLFTGVLLFDGSGQQRKAGHTIYLAPDGARFLAVEQRSGKDGEDWTLYALSGKKLWTGYAGIVRSGAGGDAVYAQYVHPSWNADASLSAKVSCSDTLKGTVTLQTTRHGLTWLPVPQC